LHTAAKKIKKIYPGQVRSKLKSAKTIMFFTEKASKTGKYKIKNLPDFN